MSPETMDNTMSILEESEIIKTELLSLENAERLEAAERKNQRLVSLREHMNYAPVEGRDLDDVVDTRIVSKETVISPEDLARVLPASQQSIDTSRNAREAISNIIGHQDDRIIAVVGPCSIHDPEQAIEYAKHVGVWRQEFGNDLEVIMRFYPEKPRSGHDWKGFIVDPLLDGSEDMNLGVVASRMVACQITDGLVPLGTERLNNNTPQFLNALMAYDSSGARNSADQKSREYISGTSSPGGIKNPPDGNIEIAVQGVVAANAPHTFMGIDESGKLALVRTTGNGDAHVILRGSDKGPNMDPKSVSLTKELLRKYGLAESIVIDASHGNSNKKADLQHHAVEMIASQISLGEAAICGAMIESNLCHGKQIHKNPDGSFRPKNELEYGKSITDECVDIEDTHKMLTALAQAVQKRRALNSGA